MNLFQLPTWAEITTVRLYKRAGSVPHDIQRQYARAQGEKQWKSEKIGWDGEGA